MNPQLQVPYIKATVHTVWCMHGTKECLGSKEMGPCVRRTKLALCVRATRRARELVDLRPCTILAVPCLAE